MGVRGGHRRATPVADPAHRPTRRRARRHGARGPRTGRRRGGRRAGPPHPGRRQFACRTGQSVSDLRRDQRRDHRPAHPASARRRRPAARADCCASARKRWPPSTGPTPAHARPGPRGPTRRVARATRRDGRHHRHIRVGVSLAGRPPARTVAVGAGARRLPDGKPDRRRIRPGRRAGLGAGAHRRGIRRPGLVLHPGLAVRRSGQPGRRRPGQHRGVPCAPTRRPAGLPSIGRRFTGGWCWPRCAGGSSAGTRPSAI